MLGLSRTEQRWRWAACGKHPVAGDYFRLGDGFSTAGLFADWMEKGYAAVSGSGGGSACIATACGWRFWAAGEKRRLVCGLVRDSNDRIGRPYPLLVVGEGPLDRWEESWETVPSACERTWGYIEYCITKNIKDLKQLEREILNTPSPAADWTGRGNTVDTASSSFANDFDFVVPLFEGEGYDVFHLTAEHTGGRIDAVAELHRLLKNRQPAAPKAFFIGGSFEKTCAIRFKRPLLYTDFSTLWSVPRMETGYLGTESASL